MTGSWSYISDQVAVATPVEEAAPAAPAAPENPLAEHGISENMQVRPADIFDSFIHQ